MPDTRMIQHFQKEADAWKRLLDFLQTESVYLKNHITELAGHDTHAGMLQRLDYFQTRLLRKEELLALLRKDVQHFTKNLGVDPSVSAVSEKMQQEKRLLGTEIDVFEKQFNQVKTEFYHYLNRTV